MRSVIVDCAIYRDGRRTEGPADFSDALDEARAGGRRLRLDRAARADGEGVRPGHRASSGCTRWRSRTRSSAHQRPKLEVYDDSLFVVLKPVAYEPESDTVTTGEVMVFSATPSW